MLQTPTSGSHRPMTTNEDAPLEGNDSTESADTTAATTDTMSLTPTARQLLLEERDRTCVLCGATPTADNDVDLHVHHKRPKSEGGSDHPDNLVIICETCHTHHHGNGQRPDILEALEVDSTDDSEDVPEDDQAPQRPLPPHSDPTERDSEILDLIKDNGPVRTGVIAEGIDRSTQYTRVLLWKLAGEDLIARTTDDRWDIRGRVDDEDCYSGLPENPELAYQAGRDEMIRRMAANNLQQGEIADIADCSRNTVRNAVNRARALAAPLEEELDIDGGPADSMAVASQLRRLARVLDTHDGDAPIADGNPESDSEAVASETASLAD